MAQAKKVVAPVYNQNGTKAFEEEITNIGQNGAGYKVGTIENSFGRKGRVQATYNKTLKRWEYL